MACYTCYLFIPRSNENRECKPLQKLSFIFIITGNALEKLLTSETTLNQWKSYPESKIFKTTNLQHSCKCTGKISNNRINSTLFVNRAIWLVLFIVINILAVSPTFAVHDTTDSLWQFLPPGLVHMCLESCKKIIKYRNIRQL